MIFAKCAVKSDESTKIDKDKKKTPVHNQFRRFAKNVYFPSLSNSVSGGCVSISNASTTFIEESTFNCNTMTGDVDYATGLNAIVCFCVFTEDSVKYGFELAGRCSVLNIYPVTFSSNAVVQIQSGRCCLV